MVVTVKLAFSPFTFVAVRVSIVSPFASVAARVNALANQRSCYPTPPATPVKQVRRRAEGSQGRIRAVRESFGLYPVLRGVCKGELRMALRHRLVDLFPHFAGLRSQNL